MKNKPFRRYFIVWLLSILCAVLSGCVNLTPSKVVTKLYALGPIEATSVKVGQSTELHVSRPNLPVYLDGKRLQYRGSNGEIGELRGARWAEHLEEGVARSLAEYLIQVGATQVTGFYPWPQRSRDGLSLRVRFFKLGALEDGSIRMLASWDLLKGSTLQKSGVFESSQIQWDPSSAESLVAGLNSALEEFAREIVTEL